MAKLTYKHKIGLADYYSVISDSTYIRYFSKNFLIKANK